MAPVACRCFRVIVEGSGKMMIPKQIVVLSVCRSVLGEVISAFACTKMTTTCGLCGWFWASLVFVPEHRTLCVVFELCLHSFRGSRLWPSHLLGAMRG